MGNAKRPYRQLELIMSVGLGCDTGLFILYLVFSALGLTALKVVTAVLVFALSACALGLLYLTQEWKRRRSLWMVTAAAALVICLLVSLVAGYPAPAPKGPDDPQSAAYTQTVEESIAFLKIQGDISAIEADVFNTSALYREMLVTLLYRLENSPGSDLAVDFVDLSENDPCLPAARWAIENELMRGTDETHFSPNEPVNRQSLAVILLRYARMKGYDTSPRTDLTYYVDYSQVPNWARDALSWACAVGIIQGRGKIPFNGPKISPNDDISGGETAVIFARFLKEVAGVQPPEPVG